MFFEQILAPLGPYKGQTERTDIPLQMPVLYMTGEAFLRVEIGITGGAPVLAWGRWVAHINTPVRCFRGCPSDGGLFANLNYRWEVKMRMLSNRLGGSGVRARAITVVTGPPKT